ncbi:hypothetical protein D8674_000058 [Pyrus ussuriensis x Pyrus communis]|uniref:Uncharacterized protein n=1 Tax=Pyrus ussuriensis x Pyrus communis TaxID=2448454 RepID=A0A5N5F1Z5_9ROSA|nr:hypothetical protein D8674_000001 [Pyrus ussuriensis x Pyrus communis]KAB2597138.1 hypothetical protein D8674_000058 [Pyrus ussuriensis x Pyrus communis]
MILRPPLPSLKLKSEILPSLSGASIPSSVSVSASALPSQACAAVPPQRDVPPYIIPTWFEGTSCPPLVIHLFVDHVTLPISASRLRNVGFACALLRATISPADFIEFFCRNLHFLMLSIYQAYVWIELKNIQFDQQTLKDVHEAEILRYIDAAMLEEMKAKDY